MLNCYKISEVSPDMVVICAQIVVKYQLRDNIRNRKEDLFMDSRMQDLRSWKNPKARVKFMQGHFVTTHSHINTYIDLSTMKSRCNNARETAKVMAEPYLSSTEVDTIVCLDGMDVIGTFMADILSRPGTVSVNSGKNISIVPPELNQSGQMMFRDNTRRMIEGQQVLIVAGLITTGKTMLQAIESVLYYGGKVTGVCAAFSLVSKVAGMNINAVFNQKDFPDYKEYGDGNCPMCAEGKKIDAFVNSYGHSAL